MRKRTAFWITSVLGTGMSLGAAQFVRAADAERPREGQRAANTERQIPQLPNGFQMKELNQMDNVRGEVSAATEDAMTEGNFGKFVRDLSEPNQDRMKDWKNQDFKTLDGVIRQIKKDWNAKYGHDFDIGKPKDLWTDNYTVVQGVVTDANVAATNFPVPAIANREGAQAAAHQDLGQAQQVLAKDLQDSRGVALFRFPGHEMAREGSREGARDREGLPELIASLIEEGYSKWRFVIPLATTSQQLHTQLQNQLTYFGRDASAWPADEKQAYRMLAHRVAAAMYGWDEMKAEGHNNR